jgi:hypothetical protein
MAPATEANAADIAHSSCGICTSVRHASCCLRLSPSGCQRLIFAAAAAAPSTWLLLQVIAKFGPELSINVLDSMPYADAVVREVLRVAPPSAQVMRQTLVDMEVRPLRFLGFETYRVCYCRITSAVQHLPEAALVIRGATRSPSHAPDTGRHGGEAAASFFRFLVLPAYQMCSRDSSCCCNLWRPCQVRSCARLWSIWRCELLGVETC